MNLDRDAHLRLHSIHGIELLNLKINGEGRQELDLSEISEGVYLLTIQNNTELFFQDKIIIIN